jgi:2,3-bisphosphoglycerate-independent phosphoglycerate mutase
MPDHPTPLETKTHSNKPVPYLIFDSRKAENGFESFTEEAAAKSGNFVAHGPDIMNKLLELH